MVGVKGQTHGCADQTFDYRQQAVESKDGVFTLTNQKAHISVDSLIGRGERTQTFDLSVPNRARYQLRHTPMDNPFGLTEEIITEKAAKY